MSDNTPTEDVLAGLRDVGEVFRETKLATLEVVDKLTVVIEELAVERRERERTERNLHFRSRIVYGVLGALSVVILGGAALVFANKVASDRVTDERVTVNRDRVSCVSALTFQFQQAQGRFDSAKGEYDTAFGRAIAASVVDDKDPKTPPSPEMAQALADYAEATTRLGVATRGLDRANGLLDTAPEQCFGAKPNPDPVPR